MLTKEDLIYTTTKIIKFLYNDKETERKAATGFFYKTASENYYLISNKHFYKDAKEIKFRILVDRNGDIGECQMKMNVTPVTHSNYDFGAICINSAIDKLKIDNVTIINKIITKEDIIPLTKENFSSIENAIIIGHPNGEDYGYCHMPFIKRGVISTPLFLTYNDENDFILDCFNIEGSSGSPVFVCKKDIFYLVGIQKEIRRIDRTNENTGASVCIKSSIIRDFMEN